MATKNISMLVNFHHPYIRHSDETASDYVKENSLLFDKITNLYIPFLNMISKMETEKLDAKIAVVFSTPLCSLLSDEEVIRPYEAYLDNLIDFGKKEVSRTKNVKEINKNAVQYLEKILETKINISEDVLLKYLWLHYIFRNTYILYLNNAYFYHPKDLL